MKRPKPRIFRVYAVMDQWGGAGMSPAEEVARAAEHLSEMLNAKFSVVGIAEDFRSVPDSTDVLVFDFGGAAGGYHTTNVFADRCREVRRWAEDHPSALVVVESSFTWERGGFRKGDWDDLIGREHEPPPPNILPLHDYRVRKDGLDEVDEIGKWLGIHGRPRDSRLETPA